MGTGSAHASASLRATSGGCSGSALRERTAHLSCEALRSHRCWTQVAFRFGDDSHWSRIVFNLLVSNVDDHLRNHGFIMVPGKGWRLSEAYDMNPVPESHGLTLN